jgi:phage gpG-like protein
MIGINVKIDGQDKILRRIDAISALPKNLIPLYKRWVPAIRKEWENNFANQEAEGRAWAALKYKKPKEFEGNPIGINTGEMKNAVSGIGKGAVTIMDKKSLEIGVQMNKAEWFHKGTRKQTTRPLISLDNPTKNKLMQILRLWIKEAVK